MTPCADLHGQHQIDLWALVQLSVSYQAFVMLIVEIVSCVEPHSHVSPCPRHVSIEIVPAAIVKSNEFLNLSCWGLCMYCVLCSTILYIRSPPEEPHLAWVDATFSDFRHLSWAYFDMLVSELAAVNWLWPFMVLGQIHWRSDSNMW